jgi:hypothetical protein
MLELSVIVYHIVEMYQKNINLTNDGNLGEGLPAPRKKYVAHNIDSSCMLCEYVNVVDEEPFLKWLTLNETLEICMYC